MRDTVKHVNDMRKDMERQIDEAMGMKQGSSSAGQGKAVTPGSADASPPVKSPSAAGNSEVRRSVGAQACWGFACFTKASLPMRCSRRNCYQRKQLVVAMQQL